MTESMLSNSPLWEQDIRSRPYLGTLPETLPNRWERICKATGKMIMTNGEEQNVDNSLMHILKVLWVTHYRLVLCLRRNA